jgi:uncharacterized protein (DUF302 family)
MTTAGARTATAGAGAAVGGLVATVEHPLTEAESLVRQALAQEGFGVLTEIDVAAVLGAKLGVRRPGLKILGACNPSFAHRALTIDASLALLIPCNVVLEDLGQGRTQISIADPRALLALGERAETEQADELGQEAAGALNRALDRVRR